VSFRGRVGLSESVDHWFSLPAVKRDDEIIVEKQLDKLRQKILKIRGILGSVYIKLQEIFGCISGERSKNTPCMIIGGYQDQPVAFFLSSNIRYILRFAQGTKKTGLHGYGLDISFFYIQPFQLPDRPFVVRIISSKFLTEFRNTGSAQDEDPFGKTLLVQAGGFSESGEQAVLVAAEHVDQR